MPAAPEALFDGKSCRLAVSRPASGVVLVTFSGHDVGEFGDAPRKEIERSLPGAQLFIDARDAQGATIDVSGAWAAWLKSNRGRIARVHMLTGSRLIRVSAEFVRRWSELEAFMQLYGEPSHFDAALSQAVADAGR